MKMRRFDVVMGIFVILIFLYVWSISTPGAMAESYQPYQPSPQSPSEVDALNPVFMSFGYLAAFFIGGTTLTLVQENKKNKSHEGNDLIEKRDI